MDTSSGAERDRTLDGLRALAMLSVLVYHFALPSHPLLRWGGLGTRIIPNLDLGVEIFFVLSGYLIFRPFCAANLAGTAPPSLRSYALHRALRIYPAYWLAFAALLAIGEIHVEGGAGSMLAHVMLVHTYFYPDVFDGIGPSWTLVVELSFYALVPLFGFALRRAGARAHAVFIAALTALGFAVRWYTLHHHMGTIVTVLPPALAALGAGMALALVSVVAHGSPRVRTVSARLGAQAWAWWSAAAALFAVVMVKSATNTAFSIRAANSQAELWHRMLAPLIAVLLVSPFVLASRAPGLLRRVVGAAPLAWIGMVSYGAYLWHHTLVNREPGGHLGVDPALLDRHGVALNLLVGAGVTALTLGVAAVSFYCLERPAMRLARRLGTAVTSG